MTAVWRVSIRASGRITARRSTRQLGRLLAGHARPRAAVHPVLADPLAQRLRAADAEPLRYRHDRRPVRRILRPHLGDHPDSPLTQLRRVVASSTRDPAKSYSCSLKQLERPLWVAGVVAVGGGDVGMAVQAQDADRQAA